MGITAKTPYVNVWVVYVDYRPAFDIFPNPTDWTKFKTKKEADAYYKKIVKNPDVVSAEAPRIYKYYQLPCETHQVGTNTS